MTGFPDNSVLWGLHNLGKTFVIDDTSRRLEPATWLLLCLGHSIFPTHFLWLMLK